METLKKKNLFNRREAVSAVVGIILMVSITVAIAFTVYWYVANYPYDNGDSSDDLFVEGWVSEAYTVDTIEVDNESMDVWHVMLSNDYVNPTENNTYFMLFTGNLSGPPTDVHIRCYYEMYEHSVDSELKGIYYKVYRVRSL